jgi:hypothetical protein
MLGEHIMDVLEVVWVCASCVHPETVSVHMKLPFEATSDCLLISISPEAAPLSWVAQAGLVLVRMVKYPPRHLLTPHWGVTQVPVTFW